MAKKSRNETENVLQSILTILVLYCIVLYCIVFYYMAVSQKDWKLPNPRT